MKSKNLLYSSLLLLGGTAIFLTTTSSSNGQMGASTSGCGGGNCHGTTASNTTIAAITGLPLTGYVSGTAYSLTITVANITKAKAGFDLSVSGGVMTTTEANTMIMSGTEFHHTSPKAITGGLASWTFSWTAPSGSSTVNFNIAGNAVDGTGTAANDEWNKISIPLIAKPSSVNDISTSVCSIYPNPSFENLNVKTVNDMKEASFMIVSMNGSVLKANAVRMNAKEYSISTSSLPVGNYVLVSTIDGIKSSNSFCKK
jgi:hypothetical protein